MTMILIRLFAFPVLLALLLVLVVGFTVFGGLNWLVTGDSYQVTANWW